MNVHRFTVLFCLRQILTTYIFTCAVSAYLGGPLVYAAIIVYSLYHVILKDRFVKHVNYLCLGIFVIAFLSIIVNFEDIEPVFKPMDRIIMLLVVMLALSPILNNQSIFLFRKKIFIGFSVGLFFMAVSSAILALTGFGYVNGYLLGLSNWPNSLGYALGISLIAMLTCLANAKWWLKILFLTIIGLCIVTIPKTGTRTTLYSLPVILFLYTYFNSDSTKLWIKRIFIMLLTLVCFFAVIKLDMSLIEKKNDIAKERGTNSREAIFRARLKEFNHSPILGIGTFRCFTQYQEVNSSGNVEAGNSFLMFLSMNGIIGFVVFISFYIKAIITFIKYILRKRKYKLSPFEQYLSLVLVFNFIYMLQAGALLNPGFYITGFNWLSLSMAYMYPRYNHLIKKSNGTN